MAAQDTQVEDPSKPSMRFAGTSKRGGPKGVMDDYKLAQADLERRVRALSPPSSFSSLL